MHILTTLQNDGAQSEFDETQGGKQSARASTNDNDLWAVTDIRIFRMLVFIVCGLFINKHPHLQIHKDSALAGIDATTKDTHSRHRAYIKAIFVSQPRAQRLFIGSHLWLYPNLIFVGHSSVLKRSFISSISSLSNHLLRRSLAFC